MEAVLADKRFFYIEDDKQNREIIQMAIEMSGGKIEFEPWGLPEITVSRIKLFKPDLILLDLMFPSGITGYDIYKNIRDDIALANCAVVAVSASDATIEIPKAQRLGFAGFISKPIDIRSFPQQIA